MNLVKIEKTVNIIAADGYGRAGSTSFIPYSACAQRL